MVILTIMLMALVLAPAKAQTADTTTAPSSVIGGIGDWINENLGGTLHATNWTFAAYPTYAPEAKNDKGLDAKWGGGIATLYNVSENVKTGMRVDYIGDKFFMPSANLQLQASITVFKLKATPFLIGGVAMPINGTGDGTVAGIAGAGASVKIVSFKHGDFCLAGAVEKWTNIKGNVYHFGPVIHWSF